MAISRLDIDSSVDRLLFVNGRGHMLGLSTRQGTSCATTTGVPTAGIIGFAPGAIWVNFLGSPGSVLYTNIGNNGYGTNAGATWLNIA